MCNLQYGLQRTLWNISHNLTGSLVQLASPLQMLESASPAAAAIPSGSALEHGVAARARPPWSRRLGLDILRSRALTSSPPPPKWTRPPGCPPRRTSRKPSSARPATARTGRLLAASHLGSRPASVLHRPPRKSASDAGLFPGRSSGHTPACFSSLHRSGSANRIARLIRPFLLGWGRWHRSEPRYSMPCPCLGEQISWSCSSLQSEPDSRRDCSARSDRRARWHLHCLLPSGGTLPAPRRRPWTSPAFGMLPGLSCYPPPTGRTAPARQKPSRFSQHLQARAGSGWHPAALPLHHPPRGPPCSPEPPRRTARQPPLRPLRSSGDREAGGFHLGPQGTR
mmetsp:Transcript_31337/g.43787  ORF Transcript_31337/g.43787 Transcript_31337/m.43787 type:complete len:339 (-) Transcript_31337:83-1099(-)